MDWRPYLPSIASILIVFITMAYTWQYDRRIDDHVRGKSELKKNNLYIQNVAGDAAESLGFISATILAIGSEISLKTKGHADDLGILTGFVFVIILIFVSLFIFGKSPGSLSGGYLMRKPRKITPVWLLRLLIVLANLILIIEIAHAGS